MNFNQFLMANWPYTIAIILLIGSLMYIEARHGSNKNSLKPNNAISVINLKKSMVIDIRSEAQFNQGHIARAQHMSFDTIKTMPPSLKKHKTHPILVVCERGIQCGKVVDWLSKQAFETIYQLEGGMSAWRKANLPTQKDSV